MVAVLTHPHREVVLTRSGSLDTGRSPAALGQIVGGPLFSFDGRPGGIAASADGWIYLAQRDAGTIWRIAGDGEASLFAGGPLPGSGQSEHTRLYAPAGMALGTDGSLIVAEPSFHRISLVTPDRSVQVLAGGTNGYRDGPADQAMFRHPTDVAVGPDGTCYVADTGNHRIRTISPDGMVSTLAGSIYDFGDGRGAHGRFRMPAAVDVDGDGLCYVADTGNNAIRRITPDGEVSTVAGSPPGGHRDGIGPEVGLLWPEGIAVAEDGSLWVSDFGNGRLLHISVAEEASTALRIPSDSYLSGIGLRPCGELVFAAFRPDRGRGSAGCLMTCPPGADAPLDGSRREPLTSRDRAPEWRGGSRQ